MNYKEQEQVISLAPDELVGKQFNKYRIISLLGRGGMSSVYKAQHILLGNTVAIKVLHPKNLMDAAAINRFKQEAAAASRLSHPNIISVHDFDVDEGRPFQAMDCLEGISLDQELRAHGPLPVARAVHIWLQICSAMRHAHSHGIIHRDLKPTNVMLVNQDGDRDFVKIVDFGIAKILPQAGEAVHQLTQTGEVFGSPWYMSPEQCLGKRVDARSDIYSMGCLIYETLVGKPPFEGDSVLETIHKHVNEPAPSVASAVKDRSAGARLDHLLGKAMAKDPDERYQSMEELADDLKQVTTRGGIATSLYHQSAGSWLRALTRLRRAPLGIFAALAVTSLCCIWLAAGSVSVPAFQPRSWPLLSLPSRAVAETSGVAVKFDVVLPAVLKINLDSPAHEASAYRRLSSMATTTGQFDKAAELACRLRELLVVPKTREAMEDPAVVDLDVVTGDYMNIAEGCYYASPNATNRSNALWFLNRAALLSKDVSPPAHREAEFLQADLLVREGRYDEAYKIYKSFLGPNVILSPHEHLQAGTADYAVQLVDIAETQKALMHWSQAADRYDSAARAWLDSGVEKAASYAAQCWYFAGTSNLQAGRNKKAIGCLKQSANLYTNLQPGERTNLPAVYRTLADANRRDGNFVHAVVTELQARVAAWNSPHSAMR